jgi:hypothetical protein
MAVFVARARPIASAHKHNAPITRKGIAATARLKPKSSLHTALRACLPTAQLGHAVAESVIVMTTSAGKTATAKANVARCRCMLPMIPSGGVRGAWPSAVPSKKDGVEQVRGRERDAEDEVKRDRSSDRRVVLHRRETDDR